MAEIFEPGAGVPDSGPDHPAECEPEIRATVDSQPSSGKQPTPSILVAPEAVEPIRALLRERDYASAAAYAEMVADSVGIDVRASPEGVRRRSGTGDTTVMGTADSVSTAEVRHKPEGEER